MDFTEIERLQKTVDEYDVLIRYIDEILASSQRDVATLRNDV